MEGVEEIAMENGSKNEGCNGTSVIYDHFGSLVDAGISGKPFV